VNPRQGTSRLRHAAALIGAAVLLAACVPAANADESAMPTTQARAYNADWVPYLDPPEKPAAVCLVDSGVNITPDTPADSPEGPIVKRLALDGGPGTAAGSSWEALHGTRMAMVGAAPVNGWGAVGFWPGVRIVSIRAIATGATAFTFNSYSRALQLCSSSSRAERIVAVNLSLGCDCEPTQAESALLRDRITAAHANDESVIAAAGNTGGAVTSPANELGVMAVAAGDRWGGLCSFSSRGVGVDLLGPGCEDDLADPLSGAPWAGYSGGSSGAAMTASVVVALLRSYRPDLDWKAAEAFVAKSARASDNGPVLDVEKLFRAAGLSKLVDDARARRPNMESPRDHSPPAPRSSADEVNIAKPPLLDGALLSTDPPAGRRDVTPRIEKINWRGTRLTVVVANRPRRTRVALLVQLRRGEFGFATAARATRRSSRVTVALRKRRRGGRVVVWYELPTTPSRKSRTAQRQLPR
jgi:hypothetical protein